VLTEERPVAPKFPPELDDLKTEHVQPEETFFPEISKEETFEPESPSFPEYVDDESDTEEWISMKPDEPLEEPVIEEAATQAVEEVAEKQPVFEVPVTRYEQKKEWNARPAAAVGIHENVKGEITMDTMETNNTVNTAAAPAAQETSAASPQLEITDEVSVITAGTSIKGNMETTGSFEIEGHIEGDLKCNGKLTVIGSIVGNSSSSEFFADAAHVEGEVVSSGTIKVGLGSVIIGNITATSAVIAGAVKGDIDVQGPVVVDTSAVIMGNIKSRSVQINNGAVIEGFCSQCYSDVDVESLFSKK
jgi:cytoskeletal protein CcmA (bactofilin family)